MGSVTGQVMSRQAGLWLTLIPHGEHQKVWSKSNKSARLITNHGRLITGERCYPLNIPLAMVKHVYNKFYWRSMRHFAEEIRISRLPSFDRFVFRHKTTQELRPRLHSVVLLLSIVTLTWIHLIIKWVQYAIILLSILFCLHVIQSIYIIDILSLRHQ